jgi:2,3-bisphosphoglycerate-independent phosphoglycerate mutase
MRAIDTVKDSGGKLHIMGLVGSGEVHSSMSHLLALIKMVAENGIDRDKLLVHAFSDGRDSARDSGIDLLDQVEAELIRKKVGRIASIVGRYFAMDRDERWDRTEKAYRLITEGQGKETKDWRKTMKESYASGTYDETLEPITVLNSEGEKHKMEAGDAVIFFNFRPDRAIQITKAFVQDDFDGFERDKLNIYFVGMTDYEDGFPRNIAFPPENITNPIGRVISEEKLPQLRIAESEKFPHVTYFLNGGNEDIYPGEDRIEVPSPRDVATYDQKPEMSAHLVTDILVTKILEKNYSFIAVNYANADMVAHTGNYDATIQAMEVLDECLGRIKEAVFEAGGTLVISADHGNAEELLDLRTGEVDTKHSVNPVPLMIIKNGLSGSEISVGNLADIAPTILNLMGIDVPHEMTGRNIL